MGIGSGLQDSSAIFQLNSNSQGILIPRLTNSQIMAIPNPADGLLIYNSDQKSFVFYNSDTHTWNTFAFAEGENTNSLLWNRDNSNRAGGKTILANTSDVVGIGTTDPEAALDILPTGNNGLRIRKSSNGTAANIQLTDETGFYTGFTAPTNLDETVLYALPKTKGDSGQVLTLDRNNELKWTEKDGIWINAGHDVVLGNLNANVGVGTHSPKLPFHITRQLEDNNSQKSTVRLDNNYHSNSTGIHQGHYVWDMENTGNNLNINYAYNRTAEDFATSSLFTFNNKGKLGIGSNNPKAELHLRQNNAATIRLETYSGNRAPGNGNGNAQANSWKWDLISKKTKFDISYTEPNSPSQQIATFNKNKTSFYPETNGFVGVGTNDPKVRLDVNGGIKIGMTSTEQEGAIRYNEGVFEVRDTLDWHPISGTRSRKIWKDAEDFNSNNDPIFWGNIQYKGDVYIGGIDGNAWPNGPDGASEFLKIHGEAKAWYLGVMNTTKAVNSPEETKSSFFINRFATAEHADFVITKDGNIGIGTACEYRISNGETAKLAVNGAILSGLVEVTDISTWCDYVFDADYNLRPLSEVESFILKNKHLPEVPSEADVRNNGINLAEMDATLLLKIEELTLYTIQQQKLLKEMRREINELKIKK